MLCPRFVVPLLCLLAWFTAAPGGAWANTPQDQFEHEFAEPLASPQTRFDFEPLGRQMLDRAAEAMEAGDEDYAAFLLDEAYDRGAQRAAGYGVALDAAIMTANLFESQRRDALTRAASMAQRMLRERSRSIDVAAVSTRLVEALYQLGLIYEAEGRINGAQAFYERAHEHGEDIRGVNLDAVEAGLRRVGTQLEIEDLRQHLQQNRTDADAAERLMRLLLIERDDPEAAHSYRFTADDRELRDHVRLANQPLDNLLPNEALALGDFYLSLSDQASPEALPQMLHRTRGYYQRYLDQNPSNQQAVNRVHQTLGDLDARLADARQPADEPLLADEQSAFPDDAPPPAAEDAPAPGRSLLDSVIGAVAGGQSTAPDSETQPGPPGDDRFDTGAPPASTRPDRSGAFRSGDAQAPVNRNTDRPRALGDDAAERDRRAQEGRDLLHNLDVRHFTQAGVWERSGDELQGGQPTPAQLRLPYGPDGHYILDTSFTRTSGTGAVVVHLPIGGNYQVLLRLGDRRRRERDHVAGLSTLDNSPSTDNESTIPFELETDRRYNLEVEVRRQGIEVHIIARLDGETLLEWEGFRAALSVAPAWQHLGPETLGLGLDRGAEATFHHVRLKMISGELTTFEQE